jgi:hypothetical protein
VKRAIEAYGPDDEALAIGLASVLPDPDAPAMTFEVLERVANPHASTFLSEIVTCRVAGAALRAFVKFSMPREARGDVNDAAAANGHRAYRRRRGGVAYEAGVYRRILVPLAAAAPVLTVPTVRHAAARALRTTTSS